MVQFAVSVVTDEFSKDLNKVCEYVASQDVEYIELRHALTGGILSINDEDLGRVKDIIQTHGLKVSCIGSRILKWKSLYNLDPDSPKYQKLYTDREAEIKRGIHVAQELDAPYIRCFGLKGHWPIPPFEEWSNWPVYQEWQRFIQLATSQAQAVQKMFICENCSGFNQSLPQIEKIAQDNVGPAFGMLFDTANVSNKFGEDGLLTQDWLKRLSRFIQYIHAKGSKKTLWWYSTTYVNGKGDLIPWSRILDHFAAMKAEDFVAHAPTPLFFSIETHMGKRNAWENSAICLKNLQELISLY